MLLDYEYNSATTFQEVSTLFNVPLSDLYKTNNIPTPYPIATDPIVDSQSETGLSGIIKIPMIQNGNESVENDGFDATQDTRVMRLPISSGRGIASDFKIGYASQYKCWINIGGTTYYFPCYPESYSDSRTAHFTTQHPMGRSEPFQIYQNSGPRVVQVSFQMHVEMTCVTPIRDLVAAVQSAEYPIGDSRSSTIVPKVILKLGDSCYIEGVIADSVNADWTGPLIDDRYVMVTLSFSVTECTGLPRTADMVRSNWAR
jgi:hypothetical protein